jgi:tRNA A37 threonylcarbamoyladenosine dehydratase
MESWFSRTELLLGKEAVARLSGAHVLVVGVGGVGAAAAEMLVRAGIGHLTLLDGDVVSDSNLNRQLNALTSQLGRPKVLVMGNRAKDINPDLDLILLEQFMSEEDAVVLIKPGTYDFVVDAIDTLAPKVSLLYQCLSMGIPVISAMGAGGKKDPSLIRQTDLSHTSQCPLARAVRRELRLKGYEKGLPVVYSTETTAKQAILPVSAERNKRSTVGTVSYMPVMFGCHMAAYVIQELSKNKL